MISGHGVRIDNTRVIAIGLTRGECRQILSGGHFVLKLDACGFPGVEISFFGGEDDCDVKRRSDEAQRPIVPPADGSAQQIAFQNDKIDASLEGVLSPMNVGRQG